MLGQAAAQLIHPRKEFLQPEPRYLPMTGTDLSLWLAVNSTCNHLSPLLSQTYPLTSSGPLFHVECFHKRHYFRYNKPLLGWRERGVNLWADINKLYPWSHEKTPEGIKSKCNEERSFREVESNYRWLSKRITWCMPFRSIWQLDLNFTLWKMYKANSILLTGEVHIQNAEHY